MKRKFLIVAGLFISGLNPLWATSSQKITSDIKIKGNSSKSLSQNQKQQRVLYELNAPEDLFLPSRSREVLVKTYQKVNLDQLENLLINNTRTIKIYLERVEQAKSILKSSLSSDMNNKLKISEVQQMNDKKDEVVDKKLLSKK